VLATPAFAFDNCGNAPTSPLLLDQTQLTNEQLANIEPQMETYFENVESYRACIDSAVSSLAPADATEEFYESSEYLLHFDALSQKSSLAQRRMDEVIERFNYLMQIAAGQ